MMGWDTAIYLLIASYLLQTALAPKVQQPRPESLSDIDIPVAEEGTPQAVIFGDCWCPNWMVLGYGNYSTSKVLSDQVEK